MSELRVALPVNLHRRLGEVADSLPADVDRGEVVRACLRYYLRRRGVAVPRCAERATRRARVVLRVDDPDELAADLPAGLRVDDVVAWRLGMLPARPEYYGRLDLDPEFAARVAAAKRRLGQEVQP